MFDKGGHNDSLDDIAVYAMMLKELDSGAKVNKITDEISSAIMPKVSVFDNHLDLVKQAENP